MTEGYQGCIFFYNSCPRVAETKLVKGKKDKEKANEKGWGRREGEGKKRREGEKRRGGREEKNLVIFLICAFLVALSIHAGVLIEQTV